MSLLLLFVSFFFAIYGAYTFLSGYTGGEKPNTDLAVALTSMAITIIPYIISKTLSEMVAIRQRHLQLEQSAQFNYMIAEQMEMAQAAARAQMAPPETKETAPSQKPETPPRPPAPNTD